jgi:hypothetical protein
MPDVVVVSDRAQALALPHHPDRLLLLMSGKL